MCQSRRVAFSGQWSVFSFQSSAVSHQWSVFGFQSSAVSSQQSISSLASKVLPAHSLTLSLSHSPTLSLSHLHTFSLSRITHHVSLITHHAIRFSESLSLSLSPLHSHRIIDSLCIFNYNRHVSAFLRVKCLPVTASGEHCGVPQDGRKGQETRKGALVPCRVFSSILGV